MKVLWNSLCMAFTTFSVFPAPQADWRKENMRYMLCALPVVGCVIGAVMAGAAYLLRLAGAGTVFRGAILTVLPILLSGGIHLDGFCDTADALASHAEPARKREIMKDSHTGAFAVIALGVYLLLYFAACCSLTDLRVYFAVPVLSRAAGAFGGTIFRGAGGTGLLSTFREGASGRSARILAVWLLLCAAALALLRPGFGIAAAAAAAFCLLRTRALADRQFEGMSGDLAGYLNALTELLALLLCVCAELIGGLL